MGKNNSKTVEKNDVKTVEKLKAKEEKMNAKMEKKETKQKEKSIKKAAKSESKVIGIIVAVVLLVALGIFGFYFYKSSFEVIATFDGGKISKAEYDVYYKTFSNILSQYYGYKESEIPEEIAKKASVDKIIVDLAKKADTKITEDNQKQLDEIFNNDDYIQNFVSQGIDIDKARNLYYNDYLITQFFEDLKEKASDEEIIAYIKENDGDDVDLNEYKTSHILFKTVGDNGEELSDEEKEKARQKAEEVLKKALAGEDFAKLAKENSEDSGTAENGGEYVCYDDGSTVAEYIKAVKELKNGQITASLVKTTYGYHIIKLNEKVENGRAHSSKERESYSNTYSDGFEDKYNVKINKDVLNKYIIAVTGKPIPTDEDEKKDENTEDTENTEVEEKTTEE